MVTLTTPKPLPANITRWSIMRVDLREDDNIGYVTIAMRTPPATDIIMGEATIRISNGYGDRASYVAPGVGAKMSGALAVAVDAVNNPDGLTGAVDAWRPGANSSGRKAALEAYLMSAGYVDASLAGT